MVGEALRGFAQGAGVGRRGLRGADEGLGGGEAEVGDLPEGDVVGGLGLELAAGGVWREAGRGAAGWGRAGWGGAEWGGRFGDRKGMRLLSPARQGDDHLPAADAKCGCQGEDHQDAETKRRDEEEQLHS